MYINVCKISLCVFISCIGLANAQEVTTVVDLDKIVIVGPKKSINKDVVSASVSESKVSPLNNNVLGTTGGFPLKITEVMSNNDKTLLASDGSSPDWIEITNFSETDFDLTGYFLTDDAANLSKWSFPAGSIVPSSGTLIVFASDDPPAIGELHASFKLGDHDYLALVKDDGITIEQDFAPFLPMMNEDVSYGFGPDQVSIGFFEFPSPGALNGALTLATGPVLRNLTENPAFDAIGIPVSIEAYANKSPLTGLTLHYLIGYGVESQIPMINTGGDLWSAIIPTAAVNAGEMLRWRVTASDDLGRVTPFPSNVPAAASPRYHGTVAPDAVSTSVFPVLHWFVEDPDWYKDTGWDAAGRTNKPNNQDLTSVSLYFDGRFYDNAQMRIRGNSAASWEKPKFKVELNEGYDFQWSINEELVDEFNLQSHFVDQFPGPRASFIREYVYRNLGLEVGMPMFQMFFMQVRQNNGYFGLYSFTEQIDVRYLRRNNLPDNGALYKAVDGASLATGTGSEVHFRKSNLKDEPFDDLAELVVNLNTSGVDQANYVFDHLDVPGIINKFAVDALTYNYDRAGHNYYVFHNPEKDEWTQLAWDTDLSFLVNDRLLDPKLNHPFSFDGNEGRSFNGMAAAILNTPASRDMYRHRLRTLMDEYLATTWMDNSLAALDASVTAERSVDTGVWSMNVVNVQADLIDYYLPTRRTQLYTTWGTLLPDAEPVNSVLSFGQVVVNPVSGNQAEEFIEITNSNAWAVDISNWSIGGGISYTFPAGSVILPNSSCYISPDVVSFRNRTISPTGGEQNFVLGNYIGNLSNLGDTLTLTDELNAVVAQTTLPVIPNDNQLYLVISELMYNPIPDGEAEFIELYNTSSSLTLDLGGVQFTDGIDYTFPIGTQLAPGARIVVTKIEFTGGSLSNKGETIKLDDADGSTISEFTYDDAAPWPETPDTIGTSLVFISGDPNDPLNWRSSTEVGGNPGTSDSITYDGGNLLDYALDGKLEYDPVTGIINVKKIAGADDAKLIIQKSYDLENWTSDDISFLGSEPMQWQTNTTPLIQFFRILVEESSP